MATIINTPNGSTDGGTSAAGWVVALVAVVLLVLLGMWFFNMQNGDVDGANDTNERANNVIIPAPVNNYNTTLNSTTTINNSTTTDE